MKNGLQVLAVTAALSLAAMPVWGEGRYESADGWQLDIRISAKRRVTCAWLCAGMNVETPPRGMDICGQPSEQNNSIFTGSDFYDWTIKLRGSGQISFDHEAQTAEIQYCNAAGQNCRTEVWHQFED